LSQRRANSVLEAMVQAGIDRGRLEAIGYGKTRPAVQGADEQSRSINRRVQFRVIEGAGAGAADPAPAPAAPPAAAPAAPPATGAPASSGSGGQQ
jgi:hypothetical protein